jgi:lysophospholipase L1-like esterase
MDRRQFLASAAAVAAGASFVRPTAAKTPPATKPSRPPAADVAWHDVREWGVEGRGFDDTENYFDRLPARAKGVVRDPVWNLAHHTTGMAVFFESDAAEFHVRYTLLNTELAMAHMPASGVSGVDLYGMTDRGWCWLATHLPRSQKVEAKLVDRIDPARRTYHLNFPLYNGVTSLEIGVPKGATFAPVAPRKDKPVLFYGTSITQGGCASRPGMSFTNILRRRLNRPVLNFGFSGNGRTEPEVARFLIELDPAVFVLDTSANTPAEQLGERTEAVVKLIRERRPATPVLLLDQRQHDGFSLSPSLAGQYRKQAAALRKAYDNLKRAGVNDLHFRAGNEFTGTDQEGTVDGSHPTDLGMMRYADALEPELRKLLPPA